MCFPEDINPNISPTPDASSSTTELRPALQVYLLQAIIESLVDGILILTTQGELLHANERAGKICRQLTPDAAFDVVPAEIWRVCQSLIDSREIFPEEKFLIESEIETVNSVKLRIKARWLQLSAGDRNFLLVTLEDCNHSSDMALMDAKRYGLTDREAEVWRLRRANLSYKEIASKLYITINTVKKHLKNIYAKQQEMLWS